MDKNMLIFEYNNDFCNNFNSIAYGSILEKKYKTKFYFENDTSKRSRFENEAKNFGIEVSYISKAKVEKIASKVNLLSSLLFNKHNINNKINIKKQIKNDGIFNIEKFKLCDIPQLDKETLDLFKFKNINFIKNFDILEDIQTSESISLYLGDLTANEINEMFDYIQTSLKRLNKYIKKPKLFIFSNSKIDFKKDLILNYQIINISDWREEFYFLTKCKHKIIINNFKTYNKALWSAILGKKDNCYVVLSKQIADKSPYFDWILI